MDLQDLKEKFRRGDYEISLHAEKERYAEDISLGDIEMTVTNGEILENYPDDPRGASCLILGYADRRHLHVVCGYTSTKSIRVITVYIPKPPKWIDARTRRPQGEHHA
jgi:uncharacterized protein DUF4258